MWHNHSDLQRTQDAPEVWRTLHQSGIVWSFECKEKSDVKLNDQLNFAFTPITFAVGFRAVAVSRAAL